MIVSTLYQFNKEKAIEQSGMIIANVSDGFESTKNKIVQTSCDVIITICKIIVNDELVKYLRIYIVLIFSHL